MRENNDKIIFYYFDDTPKSAQSVKDVLDNKQLLIELKEEIPWEDFIQFLYKNQNNFHGIILDWRLDEDKNSKANFASEALAQQCRRLVVQELKGKMFKKNFPIILCSSQPDFRESHHYDDTSKDLFDGIYEKTTLAQKGDLLQDLVRAYDILNNNDTKLVHNILGLSEDALNKINQDVKFELTERLSQESHIIIYFLQEHLIKVKGPLINEDILAARLGVDSKSPGWSSLCEKLVAFKYKGLLSSYNRWWFELIEDWYNENFDQPGLQELNADERIKAFESKYPDLQGLLNEPECENGAESTNFWTVCYGRSTPLAEEDGFMTAQNFLYPWQEREYVSLYEAKDEDHKLEKWKKLEPYEEDRLDQYYEE